jgi:hypothetical protein
MISKTRRPAQVTESKRIKAFRLDLAKQIPKFPNNKAPLRLLQAKALGPLLIDYANWAIRYVPPRPRAVVLEPSATNDSRWQSLSSDIQALLSKVEHGHDLTPHLSRRPHTRGFTPATSGIGAHVNRWADKDMLLNVMGYHHFHFNAFPMRSDDVLFAHVTRVTFTVVGIFDHTVFKFSNRRKPMMAERNRLWQIFEERATRDAPTGATVVLSPIVLSGHSIYFVNLSSNYARVIAHIDPKLDDSSYVRGLYQQAGLSVPANPKWSWHLNYLDLGLLDKETGVFFLLCKGPT